MIYTMYRVLDGTSCTHTRSRGRARLLTSQKFNGVRELVTSLHREIRARLDRVELYIYLFRFVVEECMHTFVAISTPRGPEENQESNRWSLKSCLKLIIHT